MNSACSSSATTTQQSTAAKPRPSSPTSFLCRAWDNTTPNVPRPPPATTSAWFVAPKNNKYLKKHPATAYGNMPHKRRKTTFWCSTCHNYLCLRVGSTCWSDYHTKVQFWRRAKPRVIFSRASNHPKFHHVAGRGEATGRAPVARELYFTFTVGQGTCLAPSDRPRTTPNFTTSRVGGRQRARVPVAGEFPSHHSRCGPCYLPGRLLINLDPVLSSLSLAVSCVFCNKFLNFFNFLSVFLATYKLHWPLEFV